MPRMSTALHPKGESPAARERSAAGRARELRRGSWIPLAGFIVPGRIEGGAWPGWHSQFGGGSRCSVFWAVVTRRIDRRGVPVGYSPCLIASILQIAFAPSLDVLLLGPSRDVPRVQSIIFGGVAVATVIFVPLGTCLGTLIGWRQMVGLAAALSLLALV